MLDLSVDPQVLSFAPWRAELQRQVARMLKAAARTEAAELAAKAQAELGKAKARGGQGSGKRKLAPATLASATRASATRASVTRASVTRASSRDATMQRGRASPLSIDLEASLRLTDDETIRQLNREFRHKDKPTDVLAFAQREGPWAGIGPQLLGDIVISLPTARRQAKRKSPEGVFTEVRFLASHGLCHLLGYDHNDDEEERAMNARMASLLEQAGGRGPIRAA